MSSQKKSFPDLVDNAIDNPAFELFGGYHIFLRRLIIPLIIAIFNLERYVAERKQRK